MEGYLGKKKKFKSNSLPQGRWQTRYFKAIGHHMCYSEKKDPYKVIGSFPLDEVDTARLDPRGKGEPHIFEISLKGGRCYDLRAESEAEAQAWLKYFLSFKLAGLSTSPTAARPEASTLRPVGASWNSSSDSGSRSPRSGKWGALS